MIFIIIVVCKLYYTNGQSSNIGLARNDLENKVSFLNNLACINESMKMKKEVENENCDDLIKDNDVFIDPKNIWGKKINVDDTKKLCESNLFVQGSKIKTVKYTKRGINTCENVCKIQQSLMLVGEKTKIELRDMYCSKIISGKLTCICVFKYLCQELTYYVFIHIISNRHGDISLKYFESGIPH